MSPMAIVFAVGAIMAVKRQGISSRIRRFVLLGCLGCLVHTLAAPAMMLFFTIYGAAADNAAFLDAFALFGNLVFAIAFSFVLRAALTNNGR